MEFKSENVIHQINLDEIYMDEQFNCRGKIEERDSDMVDLMRSIDSHGLQQPIVITPLSDEDAEELGKKYKVIAGHRRTIAHINLKRKVIDAIVRYNLGEKDARILNLTENLSRKNLNILQEAMALVPLINLGMRIEDLIKELPGVSRGWIEVRIALLKLPEQIRREAAVGMITQAQVRELANLQEGGVSNERLFALVRNIKEKKQQGESTKQILQEAKPIKKLAGNSKSTRKREEIFNMIRYIMRITGSNFASRCLGWAAGEVSDGEIYGELKKYALEMGVRYELPTYAGDHNLIEE